MVELGKILERIYQGFVLRDLLGFVVPGGISLLSLWIMFDAKIEELTPLALQVLWRYRLSKEWQVIALIVAAYSLAWIFQCLHYTLLRLIIWVCRGHNYFRNFLQFGGLVDSTNGFDRVTNLLSGQADIVTGGALDTDLVLAKTMTEEQLSKRLDDFPYTERLSALMLMTGNLAIAAFIFVIMLIGRNSEPVPQIVFLLTLLVPASLYIEFLRLWRARNLQVAIYAIGFRHRRLGIR